MWLTETSFQGILGGSRTFLWSCWTEVPNFRAGFKRIFHKQLPVVILCNCPFKHKAWPWTTGNVKSVPVLVGLCPMRMVNSLTMFQRWLRSEWFHGSPTAHLCWKPGFLSYKQLQSPSIVSITQSWLLMVSPVRHHFSASLSSIYVQELHQI